MQFNLNLATRSYINRRYLNGALLTCILVLMGWLVVAVTEVASTTGEISRFKRENVSIDKKLQAEHKIVPEKELNSLESKIAFANTVIDRKSFNWLEMIDHLESVLPDGVALTGIQPDLQKQMLKISGVAKGFGNVRKLMENLETSKFFTDVFLDNQSEIKVGNDQKGYGFNVTCKVSYK